MDHRLLDREGVLAELRKKKGATLTMEAMVCLCEGVDEQFRRMENRIYGLQSHLNNWPNHRHCSHTGEAMTPISKEVGGDPPGISVGGDPPGPALRALQRALNT